MAQRLFSYYRGTHGVIVVFDVTSGESFSNVKRWLQEIETNCDNVQKILGYRLEPRLLTVSPCLVGNKIDDPDRRVVVESDARRFAETMKIHYFETSAKENLNVEEVCVIVLLAVSMCWL